MKVVFYLFIWSRNIVIKTRNVFVPIEPIGHGTDFTYIHSFPNIAGEHDDYGSLGPGFKVGTSDRATKI